MSWLSWLGLSGLLNWSECSAQNYSNNTSGASANNASTGSSTSINLIVPPDVLLDYQKFMHGRDASTTFDYSGPGTRRDVVELMLVQQALRLGGYAGSINFTTAPASPRILLEIAAGRAAMGATTAWHEDLASANADLVISDAVIESGQYEAGLYTNEKNQRAMAAKNLAQVQALSALSNQNWSVDWLTLNQLGIKNKVHTVTWNSMVNMLAANRADFMLQPFQSSPDLALYVDGFKFVPIPGLKVGLLDSRHFPISRRHPLSASLSKQLNLGLAQLKKQGLLKKALIQCGFINPKVSQWQQLNPARGTTSP